MVSMADPLVSVVIGTWNLLPKLKLVLDSLNNQSFPFEHFEVVVVDSSSTDGTVEYLQRSDFQFGLNSFVVPNHGKAAARNKGILEAKGELVVITDADMIADTNFVKAHYDLSLTYNHEVMFQGLTYVLTDERLPARDFVKGPYIEHKVKHEQRLGYYYALTGNLAVPAKYFKKYGLFDEEFVNYGWEDIEFGYRLVSKNKIPLRYNVLAINYHFHVWNSYEEILRREKMGSSVNDLLNKHPELSVFVGVNIINDLIFRLFDYFPLWIEGKMQRLKNGENISGFSFLILREYFFQRGYRRSIKNKNRGNIDYS